MYVLVFTTIYFIQSTRGSYLNINAKSLVCLAALYRDFALEDTPWKVLCDYEEMALYEQVISKGETW